MVRTMTTVALPPISIMAARAMAEDSRQVVADLDIAFQAAVKRNDAATIDRILHRDFILVTGGGKIVTREALMTEARARDVVYEVQDEEPGSQTVRLYGEETAIVTAKLHIRGRDGDRAFDRKLWFSDTYVRTADGWKYAFAQASLDLPPD